MGYFLEFVQSGPWDIRLSALWIWHVGNIRFWFIWTCFINWITKFSINLWWFLHYLRSNLIIFSWLFTSLFFYCIVKLFFLLINSVTINYWVKSWFEVPNAFFCLLMSTWLIVVFLNALFTNRLDLMFFFIFDWILLQTWTFFYMMPPVHRFIFYICWWTNLFRNWHSPMLMLMWLFGFQLLRSEKLFFFISHFLKLFI